MRSLIDYWDTIYDLPQNESFWEKSESLQYKAALAITGAMQETSCDKIYMKNKDSYHLNLEDGTGA